MVRGEASTCSGAALFSFDRFPKLFGFNIEWPNGSHRGIGRSAARIRIEKLANLNVLTAAMAN
jgi:hypothetical protein